MDSYALPRGFYSSGEHQEPKLKYRVRLLEVKTEIPGHTLNSQ